MIALFGAVILIYAVGQNFGVSAGRDQVTAREHYEQAKRDNLEACTIAEGLTPVECIAEAIESAQDQSDSRQDLFAQRDMANFTFWILIFTGCTFGITGLGVWYVKRTLDATLQAVKDTGDATKAMVRQNELTEAAQRPWLAIEATVTECEIGAERTHLRFSARVTNLGKMVAERCAVRTVFFEDDTSDRGERKIEDTRINTVKSAQGDLPKGCAPYPILPKQDTTVDTVRDVIGHLTWVDLNIYSEKRLFYTLFVCVRYFVPGDDRIRETDRAFCLTYVPPGSSKDDAFLPIGIPYPLPDDIGVDRVWLRPTGHNRTT